MQYEAKTDRLGPVTPGQTCVYVCVCVCACVCVRVCGGLHAQEPTQRHRFVITETNTTSYPSTLHVSPIHNHIFDEHQKPAL